MNRPVDNRMLNVKKAYRSILLIFLTILVWLVNVIAIDK